MNKFIFLILYFRIFLPNVSLAEDYVPCLEDIAKYAARSAELKSLYETDQSERADGTLKPGTLERDRQRRQRVGAIFGEGCFKTAADFYNAAMVYQHGGDSTFSQATGMTGLAPEQVFQTFLWAKRAVELGHTDGKWLMAASIDRYLWYTGKKQLFGTQFYGAPNQKCLCNVPVEASFPDSIRVQYSGLTMQQALEHLHDIPGQQGCALNYCHLTLQPSLQGVVPGFW